MEEPAVLAEGCASMVHNDEGRDLSRPSSLESAKADCVPL
ncbi:hypothetical protein SAMN05216486_10143 [bacterium JGI 053]|nr:hypothetical protein SAMN05216486_10143 [bacterium JGI 053]